MLISISEGGRHEPSWSDQRGTVHKSLADTDPDQPVGDGRRRNTTLVAAYFAVMAVSRRSHANGPIHDDEAGRVHPSGSRQVARAAQLEDDLQEVGVAATRGPAQVASPPGYSLPPSSHLHPHDQGGTNRCRPASLLSMLRDDYGVKSLISVPRKTASLTSGDASSPSLGNTASHVTTDPATR